MWVFVFRSILHPHSKIWRCFTYSLVTQTAAFVSEDLPDSCHSQTSPKQIYSSVCLPYSYPQCEWTMEHCDLVKQGSCRVWWNHPACLLIQIFLLFIIKKGKYFCFWSKKHKNKSCEAATRGHIACAQPSPLSGLVIFQGTVTQRNVLLLFSPQCCLEIMTHTRCWLACQSGQ